MKRYKEVRFRLTLEEKSVLAALAQQKFMSQSALVRKLIQVEAREKGHSWRINNLLKDGNSGNANNRR